MPYVNVTKSETGSNAGSCSTLVAYLEKENQGSLGDSVNLYRKEFRVSINQVSSLTEYYITFMCFS